MFKPRETKKSRIRKDAVPGLGLAAWLIPFFIALLTVAAFIPVLENGFVGWDDDKTLLENPYYRGLGWIQLRWMFTTFYMGHYQPLSWMSFGLDYLLWGMDPFGYHLTSLLLHLTNAVLFYFVALRLLSLRAAPRGLVLSISAGFAALLFAVHPLRVESVAWATERRDVLSGLFFLGSILCYFRATAVSIARQIRRRWMTAAVIFHALSLLAKATGMTLPIVLLALDVYPLKRLGGGPGGWFGAEARRVWWEKVPFLLLAFTFGIIALFAQHETGALKALERYSAGQRLAQAFFGMVFYVWKFFVPQGLSPIYEIPPNFDPLSWPFVLSTLLVLAICVSFFAVRRRWPAGLAVWVSYLVILSPMLGFAQSGPQLVADRYSYLSCLGWAVLAGGGLFYGWQLCVHIGIGKKCLFMSGSLAAVILVGLGIQTWKQVQIWHDTERLWNHVLAVGQKSRFAHNNLGLLLIDRGDLERGVGHLLRALEIDPVYPTARYNLGIALIRRGSLGEAIEQFGRVLAVAPTHTDARVDLGIALARQGKLEEAVEQFRQALDIRPDHSRAHFNLGTALATGGRLEEAKGHFRESLRLKPDFVDPYRSLGMILAAQGDLNNAVNLFRQALQINPNFAEAHESLGRALALQGKRDEAMKHYQEALRIMKSSREASGSK